jgi:hypothetical protein
MKLLEAFCCYQKEEAAPPINHRVTAPPPEQNPCSKCPEKSYSNLVYFITFNFQLKDRLANY